MIGNLVRLVLVLFGSRREGRAVAVGAGGGRKGRGRSCVSVGRQGKRSFIMIDYLDPCLEGWHGVD